MVTAMVWEAWQQGDAFADCWHGWIKKFGKLAGFFTTIGSGARDLSENPTLQCSTCIGGGGNFGSASKAG
jgi:hypothetical protein